MNRRLPVLLSVLSLVSFLPGVALAEVLDRIVAKVNGHIILQSDWEDALRLEAFLNGRAPHELSSTERNALLRRLVDQELLEEQMRSADFPRASEDEVNDQVAEIRKQYPEAQGEQSWGQLLARHGITEEQLRRRLALQLDLSRLIDARLRPSVHIDAQTIASYYNHELLPRLRNSGAKEVSLDEASAGIKQLLTEQRLNQLLVAWLENLRSGSEIQTQPSLPGSPDGRR
ncbi:MAG TPA: SurA N-terminal domain-containing protein [Terriglobales bacterium]|nr:SurA N-terminal domain-containing protein [Terriglobales bacterium]